MKIKFHEVPEWLNELPTASEVRGAAVVTRQNHKLFIPRTRTKNGARSMYVEGPRFWNSLPDNVVDCQTLSCFKEKLFRYLFHQ